MKNTVQLLGLVSVLALTLTAGCSSDSGGTTATGGNTGTGGTGGTAGNGSGTGGTAGGSSATGGNGGTQGGSCTAASGALISDFSGTGGLVSGDAYTGGDADGTVAPTADAASGSLVITLNGGDSTNAYPYAYIGLGLDTCTDASAYTSVTFMASGTITGTGCTIQFSVVDKEHNTVANGGTCTAASCYAGGQVFPLAATPTAVTLNFADQPLGGQDAGVTAGVDPTQVLSVQWQVNPPSGTGCTGTVTIDDVMFQ